jgi:hypothetical protein
MSSGSARRARGTVDPRIAWGIAAASIASMPATFLLRDAASPDAVATGEDPLTALLLLVLVISLLASPAIVGAFLASRVPDNRIGPLLLVARDDVDLEHLAGDVLHVVDVSLHPTTRTLWIRTNVPVTSDAGRPVTISGRSLPTVTTT